MSDLTLESIERWWPTYGIGPAPVPGHNPRAGSAPVVDLAALMDGLPLVLEIGSGMGEATIAMARADASTGVIAAEVHTRGLARLLRAAHDAGLHNVRAIWGDGLAVLAELPEQSLVGVRAFFPDPWPKARHHKRRLVQPAFAALAASRLRPGGTLHLATDWDDYAEQMLDVLSAEPLLHNVSEAVGGYLPRPSWRPVTRYERAGLDKGHSVHDLLFERR